MSKTIYVILAITHSILAGSNIMLNGDFENHPLLAASYTCPGCAYTYQANFSNNFVDYNWYDGDNVQIQWRSKKFSNISSTTVIDSCAQTQTRLMQDVTLVSNGYYRFSFDMCKNQWEICNYLSSWIGNQNMYTMEKISGNKCQPYQKYFRWYQNGKTYVEFKGYNYDYLTTTCFYGPLVDNVTLVQLQQINRTLALSLKPSKSISPILQITTNITLATIQPDTLSKLSEYFSQISINTKIFTKCEFNASNQNKFRILLYLEEDIQITNLSIIINSFIINDTLFNFFSGNVTIDEPLTFLFNRQFSIVNFLNELNKPLSLRLRDTILIGRFLGLGSIFLDIFAFWQIAIFYHYIDIQTPNYVKYSIQQSFKNFLLFGIYKQISLQNQVYPNFNFSMQQKIPPTKSQWCWFYQLGYSSNYYKNNLESFTLIGMGLIRTVLFQIIFNLIGFKLFRMNRKWHRNLAYDIVSWIPFLVLVPAIIISSSFINFAEKINYILHLLTMFFCLLTPTFFLIANFVNLNKRYKKKSKQYMCKKVQTLYIFLEFTFIFSLTFLTGIKNKDLFLIISTSLIIVKLVYLIKYRKYFTMFDFIMKLCSGIVWFIYTVNFILFRVLELLADNQTINIQTNGFWQECFQILGISVIMIFTIGGWIYLFSTFINFIFEVKEMVWKVKKDCQRKLTKNQVQDIKDLKVRKEKTVTFQVRKKKQIFKRKDSDIKKISEKNVLIIQEPIAEPKKTIRIFVMRQQMEQLRLRKAGNIRVNRQKQQHTSKKGIILKQKFWKNIEEFKQPQ